LALAAAAPIAACGSDGHQPLEVARPTPPGEVEAAPSVEPPAPDASLSLEIPRRTYPVIWVRPGHEVGMRTAPGGGELVKRIAGTSRFGSPSVFGVADQKGDWAGVTTTLLPNNRLGWVKLDPDSIDAGWTPYSIAVDVSERRATLRKRGKAQLSFPVTVGAPGSETPTGRFSVTDSFTRLDSADYGCCAIALSATQPNLPSGWLGGRTIAIHGTDGAVGIAASHGCIRAADRSVAELVHTVPLGTPVFIDA
jgi:lipoprotein-anchoring transpeptidase ErfK/SrfK